MTECWLARWGVYERGPMPPCDGRLIRAHLVKRQVILREVEAVRAAEAISDPRSFVYACGGPMGNGGHHGMTDHSKTIRIPPEHLPNGFLDLMDELGLMWWVLREYGEQRRAA
jgi:hypothetical protein